MDGMDEMGGMDRVPGGGSIPDEKEKRGRD